MPLTHLSTRAGYFPQWALVTSLRKWANDSQIPSKGSSGTWAGEADDHALLHVWELTEVTGASAPGACRSPHLLCQIPQAHLGPL